MGKPIRLRDLSGRHVGWTVVVTDPTRGTTVTGKLTSVTHSMREPAMMTTLRVDDKFSFYDIKQGDEIVLLLDRSGNPVS